MISFNIPLLIVVIFLLLTLAVGFYFSRQTTTFREYAVGNKTVCYRYVSSYNVGY
ncbi:MAG: hypothetical protein NMK33_01065 [Candidatus Cardinium sp.]|nr:MAG: hypothetical protein NMK33_01065 [Candidatus Cardinium sp.]